MPLLVHMGQEKQSNLNHHPASHALEASQNLLMCSAPLLSRRGLCLKNVRCELACCRMSHGLDPLTEWPAINRKHFAVGQWVS